MSLKFYGMIKKTDSIFIEFKLKFELEAELLKQLVFLLTPRVS